MIELSIIIVNWNTRSYLQTCLGSLVKFENLPSPQIEVIVVDNASSDLSCEMVQRMFPWVKLVQSDENLGFGRANNLGFEMASGRNILLLNPDTEMIEPILQKCSETMLLNQKVGMYGCRLLNPNLSFQGSCGHFPSLKMLIYQNIINVILKLHWVRFANLLQNYSGIPWMPVHRMTSYFDAQQRTYVDWMIGAFMLMPRKVALQTKLFDPRFFLYGEDVDLCRRVNDLGYKILYDGGPALIHVGGASMKKRPLKSQIMHYQASLQYYKFHRGLFEYWVYATLIKTTIFYLRLRPDSKLDAD